MSEEYEITEKINREMENLSRSIAALKTDLDYLSVQYDGQANSLEALSKKQELLNQMLDTQKKKLDGVKEGWESAEKAYADSEKELDNLKAVLTQQENSLGALTRKYELAKQKLKEMEESGSSSQKALKKQRTAVQELSDSVDKQNEKVSRARAEVEKEAQACKKAGENIQDWKGKLNAASEQVKQVSSAVKENAKYMEEAAESADRCASSIDEFGEKVEKKEKVTESFGKKLKVAFENKGVSTIVNTVLALGNAIVSFGTELDSASQKLQAAAGLSDVIASSYKNVMSDIWGENYGRDFEDISDAMAKIVQNMGELDAISMKSITESVITLRDTFNMDYQESVQAANMLMQQFGINGEQAFNLIAQGAQQGLNKNGDLLSSISQYSSYYAEMGATADEFFNSLKNGTDAGTTSVSNLGTAYQEFRNRVQDTAAPTTEAFKRLGLDADSIREKFSEGGNSAKNASKQVVDALFAMENEVEQNQAGIALFGDSWKNLGKEGVQALMDLEGNMSAAKGTMEELKEVRYDNLSSSIEGLGRAVQEKFLGPIADAILPAVTEGIQGLTELIEGQESVYQEFIDSISENITQTENLIEQSKEKSADTVSEIEYLKMYREIIQDAQETLAAGGKLNALELYKVQDAVSKLSGGMPELAGNFESTTGEINLNKKALDDLFDSYEALILQQGIAKAKEDAYSAVFQADLGVEKAKAAVEEATKELEQWKKENENTKKINNLWQGDYAAEVNNAERALRDATNAQEEAIKAQEEAQVQADYTETALQSLADQYGIDIDILKNFGTQTAQTGAASKNAADSMSEDAEAVAEAAKRMSDAQKASLQSMKDKYDEIKSSIEASIENKINLLDVFNGGADVSVEDMSTNLNSQIEGLTNYAANLKAVREMVDEEGNALLSPEFFQYLQDMGPEGANILQNMVDTMEQEGSEGVQKIQDLNDQYIEAMNIKEELAAVGAANQLAYGAALGEFGSSEEDFSALKESMEYAVFAAAESWKDLPDSVKSELENTIEMLQEYGGLIPEGLAAGIESGEIAPQEAIDLLNKSLQGQFEGILAIAEECGINVGDDIRNGLAAGGAEAESAYAELLARLSGYSAEFETIGQEGGASMGVSAAAAIEEKTEASASAVQQTIEAARAVMEEGAGAFRSSGMALMQSLAVGIVGGALQVNLAAGEVAAAGTEAARGYENTYKDAGYMLALGMAQGIRSGQSRAIEAAEKLAGAALAAAKIILGIESPSKVFKKAVGEQISEGMALGIKRKSVLAENASAKMSSEVLDRATAWLDAYKEKHKVSLDDERYFWQRISSNVKKGTKAYKKAQEEMGWSRGALLKVESGFGVSRTKTNGKGEQEKKSDETYYNEVYQAASKYLSNMEVLYDLDLRQQEAYWMKVAGKMKKGTQGWYDVQKQLQNVQKNIEQEQAADKKEKASYALSGGALDTYKTYFKVSEKAEVEYWNTVRSKFKKGTAEREEADKKYFEAKKRYNDKMKDLEDDYYDKVQEVSGKLEEEIQSLTDSYEDSVRQRADAIYSSMSLTDRFESESDTGETLLYNLKTQVTGLEDWRQQLDKLKAKGIDQELLDELTAQGPEALAMLHVLNNDVPDRLEGKGMTDAQLQEYVELWRQKKELARQQAEEENEQLRIQNEQKIAALREQARLEIQACTEEYLSGVEEISKPMNKSLLHVAKRANSVGEETMTQYIQGVYNKVKDSRKDLLAVTDTITTDLTKLTKDGKRIGDDTLTGILEAMTNSKKIKKYSTAMVKKIIKETKKAAQIKSPSKLFAEEVGEYIPAGVGEGMEKNTESAVRSAENMIRKMLEATENVQKEESVRLAAYVQDMNFDAGIAQINAALQTPIQSPANVVVDNKDLGGMLNAFLSQMAGLVQSMNDKQIILDTGTLVGEIAIPVSQELAMESRAKNRGRF